MSLSEVGGQIGTTPEEETPVSTYLTTYLIFDGDARQAMEHYRSVLGGELDVMTFGDMGATGEDGPPADGVMHARLVTADGFRIFASDGAPGEPVRRGNDFAVALTADPEDAETLKRWWDAFSADGTVDVPFEQQMWGDWFGQVTDRFGVAWMFDLAGGQEPGAA